MYTIDEKANPRFTIPYNSCFLCENLISYIEHKCKAFDIIPEEIWTGGNDHKSAFAGDNGICYKPLKVTK